MLFSFKLRKGFARAKTASHPTPLQNKRLNRSFPSVIIVDNISQSFYTNEHEKMTT